MDTLVIDLESRSLVDLKKSGVVPYSQDPSTEILCVGFKLNNEPTIVLDLFDDHRDPLTNLMFVRMLTDERICKCAANAAFDFTVLNAKGYETPLEQWYDIQAHAMYLSYPGSVEKCGPVIGLAQDQRKLRTGTALINRFSKPKKDGTFNDPRIDKAYPELLTYCKQDVETEYLILQRCLQFPFPVEEQKRWRDNYLMNLRGIPIDRQLVEGAIYIDGMSTEEYLDEAKRLSGLSNPNSTQQLITWLNEHGCSIADLRKDTVEKALATDLPDDVKRMLAIRRLLSKTSIKKYYTILDMTGTDGRVHGTTQFYGATRTGRFAGRGVQMQNLPRSAVATTDAARKLFKEGNYEALKIIYGDVSNVSSSLIRTAFTASEGMQILAADYSAIEARLSAYVAREEWKLDVFRTHGKIYEATASQMFHAPIETIAKGQENYDLRQKGKIAELALGYGGSVSAMKAMGAADMGLSDTEIQDIVNRWRRANPHIVASWRELEDAMINVVMYGGSQTVLNGLYTIALETDEIYGQQFMTIELPSGRKLYYSKPFLKENRFGKPAVHYYEVGATKKWEVTSTYGGRGFENCIQALARDCLVYALDKLNDRGYKVLFHVHDEVVLEVEDHVTVDEICATMCEPIPWLPDVPLNAEGFKSPYYKKG